jgi:hypothetical protein
MMTRSGEIAVLTGDCDKMLDRWLLAFMGLSVITHGYVCIDGEPLTSHSAAAFRQLMAYSPAQLSAVGHVKVYESPSVQYVFNLKANQSLPISNGILSEEMHRVGVDLADERVQWLAVAALLDKPVMLVSQPPSGAMPYLRQQAMKGKSVIIASNDADVLRMADNVIEI